MIAGAELNPLTTDLGGGLRGFEKVCLELHREAAPTVDAGHWERCKACAVVRTGCSSRPCQCAAGESTGPCSPW